MSIDYHFYLADGPDRPRLDTLYQRYLKRDGLTPDQALELFSFVDEFAGEDDVSRWDELVEEAFGFRPDLEMTFYPAKQRLGEASKRMLRFIGLILSATPGDAVLYFFDSPILLRKQGQLSVLRREESWNQALLDALKEGMGTAQAV